MRGTRCSSGEIDRFLAHLALTNKVSLSTHRQALCAVLFLYRYVLKREIENLGEVAVDGARITKRAASHSLKRSFATHLLDSGYDIRTVQELLGHKDARTIMIYAHVLNRRGKCVRSPMDSI